MGVRLQLQNAALVYNATDWIIDVINAHPQWGVTAEYCTASEYLAAIQHADVALPVKEDKQTFFPYNSWSGYFTSRPKLKGLSQQAHGPLHAAEGLFALRGVRSQPERQRLWDLLETARRNAGVVQHHDAITGTPCSSEEGCSGMSSITGAHNSNLRSAPTIRLQLSAEHKTRIRLYVSDDPAAGGRIELAHRIGVLEPMTELISRFSAAELSTAAFYSEDNGLETIKHRLGTPLIDPVCKESPNASVTCWHGEIASIPRNHWPSQMSTFLDDGDHQLGVALERSHGVASLSNGTLDVVQHRRGGPTNMGGPKAEQIVLDDVDRILTQTWLSVGNSTRANALRHSNKLRVNHPLVLLFARTDGAASFGVDAPVLVDRLGKMLNRGLPVSVHLQAVRATSVSADEVLLSVLNVVGAQEPGAETQSIDLGAVVRSFRPELAMLNETTLNGLTPKAELERMQWKTDSHTKQNHAARLAPKDVDEASPGQISLRPLEMRVFMATLKADDDTR